MKDLRSSTDVSRCVLCGACKALCPTYLFTLDETMGARGRVAMLGALKENELSPSKRLSDTIFSCILCEACSDTCPTGINIPEVIYRGRITLRDHYRRGHILRAAMRFSSKRMDSVFAVLRFMQKIVYPALYRAGKVRYIPEIASPPFKEIAQVYKNINRIGRVAVFAGCSVNYFYPRLGTALLSILLRKGYEVVVLKGETCCGAPMRSLGLEEEAVRHAKKNIELFNKMRVEAILCLCPTCTMTIKKQYPLLADDRIEKVMDINEFFLEKGFARGLRTTKKVITYHDPCHLRYGLGIKDEPRELLKGIRDIDFVEMQDAAECCGYGGAFSLHFKDLSKKMGKKKLDNAIRSQAETIVTSCPGCMMQLEDIGKQSGQTVSVMHIVEIVNEAMQG